MNISLLGVDAYNVRFILHLALSCTGLDTFIAFGCLQVR